MKEENSVQNFFFFIQGGAGSSNRLRAKMSRLRNIGLQAARLERGWAHL